MTLSRVSSVVVLLLCCVACSDNNTSNATKDMSPEDMSGDLVQDQSVDLPKDMVQDQPQDLVTDTGADLPIDQSMDQSIDQPGDQTMDQATMDMTEDMRVDMMDDQSTSDMADMVITPRVSDDFAGNGPLMGYTTNNPNSLPDIQRVDGRYRANLTNNSNNITLHFNQDQGRLDAKVVSFPFEYIARNIGIGTQQDSQVAPPPTGDPYLFAGVQVHVLDLNARDSSHIVVGHRGGAHFTVEGKNTVNGRSSVNDVGFNAVPDGRADIRVVGNADRTLTIYWQTPNLNPSQQADNWTLYRNTGTLPGAAPAYGAQVYIGLITYAYGSRGVPFVGTCDGVELVGE